MGTGKTRGSDDRPLWAQVMVPSTMNIQSIHSNLGLVLSEVSGVRLDNTSSLVYIISILIMKDIYI